MKKKTRNKIIKINLKFGWFSYMKSYLQIAAILDKY